MDSWGCSVSIGIGGIGPGEAGTGGTGPGEAGIGGRCRGAGTGFAAGGGTGSDFVAGGGTGSDFATGGGTGSDFAAGGGTGTDFAAGGSWLGRQELDFSADLTDVIGGSNTFALRSALLETHFRARGYSEITAGGGTIIAAGGAPAQDRRLSRHLIPTSLQSRLEVSGSSIRW